MIHPSISMVEAECMRLADLEPFKQVPFYFRVKNANSVYLWGSTPLDRFAG